MLLSQPWPASNTKKSVLRSCKAKSSGISNKLDYCNSLFPNMPEKDITRLQRVQICLAIVVTKAPRFSRSIPIIKRLPWLPVKFRIHFKICAIILWTLKDKKLAYQADLLVRPKCSKYFCSTNSNRFVVPRIKNKIMGQDLSLYLAQPYGTPCLCPYVLPKQF